MDFDNPTIVAAVIAASVSLVTVILGFVFKAWFEKHFFIFSLDAEHRYAQKKKIKEVLAKYKTQLLDSGESLNHRLWNFSRNYTERWHYKDNPEDYYKEYYLTSFVYRVITFYAWIEKVNSEMVYLDTTIASKDDLNFVKFLRLLNHAFCDVELFEGMEYDKSKATDHFFQNEFVHMCRSFWTNDRVVTFSEFKSDCNSCQSEALPMAKFINGINPDESRLRWDRLQVFHYILLMFLNSYGYDFQRTNEKKVRTLTERFPRPNKTLKNLHTLVKRLHLDHQREVKSMLKLLTKIGTT